MKSKVMLAATVAVVFSLLTIGLGSPPAEQKGKAKSKKAVIEKAQKSRGGGQDENIKSDKETNDPNAIPPAPPNKGGEKSRGVGACAVFVDNSTGYYIRIYVDGTYRGTISPWGDDYTYTGAGPTRLYAVAVFEDGSRLTWGPRVVDCYSSYSWRLTP